MCDWDEVELKLLVPPTIMTRTPERTLSIGETWVEVVDEPSEDPNKVRVMYLKPKLGGQYITLTEADLDRLTFDYKSNDDTELEVTKTVDDGFIAALFKVLSPDKFLWFKLFYDGLLIFDYKVNY